MKPIKFWRWFFCGIESSRSGLVELCWDISTLICLLLSLFLAYIAQDHPIDELAKGAIFPLVGILIGVSFTGASFALSNLKADEIKVLISRGERRFEYYIFGIQSVALLLLIAVCLCTLITMGIFSSVPDIIKPIFRFFIFFLFLMSVWQCWKVIGFSISLTHLQVLYRKHKEELTSNTEEETKNGNIE